MAKGLGLGIILPTMDSTTSQAGTGSMHALTMLSV